MHKKEGKTIIEFNVVNRLLNEKEKGTICRLGTLFFTDHKKYFYDTGTGKVLELDDDGYKILNYIFYTSDKSLTIEQLNDLFSKEKIQTFNDDAEKNNIFMAYELKKFSGNHIENISDKLNNEVEQIILELTGKCNLRCKYCIYNDEYIYNRNFNRNDMTKDIAKRAIDYLFSHSKNSKKKAVTFYGGEPLINFELLKWSIEYALKIFKGDVFFSLTTNLTLITPKIAKYLGTVPNLTIVLSIDGPKEIHNKCRVYHDEKGSYDDAIRGLKLLVNEIKEGASFSLMINSVFTPPYSMKEMLRIINFFDSIEDLPETASIQITYPTAGSYVPEKKEDFILSDREEDKNPIWEWIRKTTQEEAENVKNQDRYVSSMYNALTRIHNRILVDKPLDYYNFHSCCVPGVRRLYVDTEGNFLICEKIGSSPFIGNVYEGVDLDLIKKHFIDDYNSIMTKTCKNCWAIRLCHGCFADRYTETGIRKDLKFNSCDGEREAVKNELSLYHGLLENNSPLIEKLSKITIF